MASGLTWEQTLYAISDVYGEGSVANVESVLNAYGIYSNPQQAMEFFGLEEQSMGGSLVSVIKNNKGNTIGMQATIPTSTASNINSNVVNKVQTRVPIRSAPVTNPSTGQVTGTTFSGGMRETGKYVFGKVASAVCAVGTGIWLGKEIDSTLYNANPDFWDNHNMSSINPDTWASITTGNDSLGATLFNLVFGINPETGEAESYIDENALAYLAMYMNSKGVFSPTEEYTPPSDIDTVYNSINISHYYANTSATYINESGGIINSFVRNNTKPVYFFYVYQRSGAGWGTNCSLEACSEAQFQYSNTGNTGYTWYSGSQVTINNKTFYVHTDYGFSYSTGGSRIFTPSVIEWTGSDSIADVRKKIAYGVLFGSAASTYEGITDQTGATLPDTTNWDSLDNTKQSLQTQYPDKYNNAKHYDYVDENGNQKSTTYIPFSLPDNFSNNKPTSGDGTQNRTKYTLEDATQDLIDTLTDLLKGTPTPGAPAPTEETNPPNTGSGTTGTTVIPTGQASSLWKIYNPTQAQVDAFGSWLWDSSFVEQIKKLFNDPMQAIIGIHKVFASPSIGGTATIKVGYLDSQVSSAWVDNQYTTVNCGSANLREYFGNVFDYAPYTKVQLYLPFIGIVDLDVGDVMRSTISVVYHVDVLTGACLADVKVNRDSAGGVLYQYAGSAIVTYPVSAGNYMGMLAGVLSVAGGVAGTILSGGALAPALIGGAVGASHLHTDVSHSGGFSGCAGAMGGKKPYLIVSRPQIAMADNYQHYTGIPANSKVTLGNCNGYAKVRSVYVNSITRATEEEKNMIEAELKAGVLV